ncbi:hypothetical protein OEZ85_002717 [Tetradesmus obliquus]|uniref:Thioredoxin domain-containing protein n=1 Tax=Tetradesmus obliquus TaxID=3088 RepID=A0ABY8U2K2_TETOB|nr:hypothetical protein OEZ85_002717 [Tetradesmus obliquus]
MQRHASSLLLLLLLVAASSSTASDEPDKKPQEQKQQQQEHADVLGLTTDTFADVIERQPGPALVMFMIPDCQACHALMPDLQKVAANLKGIASVATVNCGNVHSVRTCRAFGVREFPRLLVFKTGTKTNPYTGGAMKEFDKYAGAPGARALVSAVTDKLDDSQISHISSSSEHEAFLQQQPKLAKVLLFTDKNASTVLYKGLSWSYARRLGFGEVRSNEATAALLEQYGVAQMPTLLVVKADGSRDAYTGPLKAVPLRAFLDGHALKEPLPEAATAGPGGAGKGAAGPDGMMGEVVLHALDASNLTEIDSRHEMWLLAFYRAAEGATCSAELEKLSSLLREVQSIVQYGSVNAAAAAAAAEGNDASLLLQYGADVAALEADGCKLQLVLLPHGKGKAAKGNYARWSGGLDDFKALQDWILEQIPDFTIQLSNEVEADAFVKATADSLPPDAIRSAEDRRAPIGKVFLFTTKSSVPGMYKALAAQHFGKSRMLFGWATTAHEKGPALPLMQKMNVRKPPAMSVLLPLPPKPIGDPDSAEQQQQRPPQPGGAGEMAIQQYFGPLKFQKMAAWVQGMAMLTGMAYKRHAGATPAPEAHDLDIHTQAQLQAACYDKPSLCLMTLLDGSSGSTANKARDTIRKVATALAGQPLTWVAVDVSRQSSFRRAYGFESEQLPALVALSTKRMRFAQGAAPFGEASAKQLVTKVLAGSAVTLPLPALPQLVDGGEPDEEPALSAQEEFDLSEVMAEEVATVLSKEEKLQQAYKEIEAAEKAKKKAKTTTKKKSKKKKSSKKSKKKSAPSPAKDEL